MEDQQKQKIAANFARQFAGALSTTLTEMTGEESPLEVLHPAESPVPKGNLIQFQFTFEGDLSGECFAEFYEPRASKIAQQISGKSAGDNPADPGDVHLKMLEAVGRSLAASLAEKFGSISLKVDRSTGLAFGGMVAFPIASPEDISAPQTWLYFGGPLLDELVSTGASAHKSGNQNTACPANLKLVMDVELNVSLRFGQREMPLREVLELGSGSLVELDRLVDEPVELFLDGKLIARGEAVIVDGNYGLRITEIPQPVASYFLN